MFGSTCPFAFLYSYSMTNYTKQNEFLSTTRKEIAWNGKEKPNYVYAFVSYVCSIRAENLFSSSNRKRWTQRENVKKMLFIV